MLNLLCLLLYRCLKWSLCRDYIIRLNGRLHARRLSTCLLWIILLKSCSRWSIIQVIKWISSILRLHLILVLLRHIKRRQTWFSFYLVILLLTTFILIHNLVLIILSRFMGLLEFIESYSVVEVFLCLSLVVFSRFLLVWHGWLVL